MLKLEWIALSTAALSSCGGGDGAGVPQVAEGALQATESVAHAPAAQTAAGAPTTPTLQEGPVTVANSTRAGDQALRGVGATADGGYVLVWLSDAGPLMMQAYNDKGTKTGAETAIVIDVSARAPDAAAQAIQQASAAVLDDGSVVVLYRVSRDVDAGTGQTRSATGAYVQHVDRHGMSLGAAQQVDVIADLGGKSPFLGRPSVLALTSDGGFVVAWTVTHYSSIFSSLSTLYLRWFDKNARPVGAPAQVGDFPELAFSLQPDERGGFALTIVRTDNFYRREAEVEAWSAAHSFVEIVPPTLRSIVLMPLAGGYVLFEGDSTGASGQLLNAQGTATMAATPLPSLPAAATELADGTYLTLRRAGNGAFAVEWFASDMSAIGTPAMLDSRGVLPQLATLSEPEIVSAWTGQSAKTGTDIYTQRFDAIATTIRKACLASARQQHLTGEVRKAFMTACDR
ncbi:hypothetical protein IM725_03685 [Ramlibacter aquaticus]|uniref:Lipoprotein n=1 Tax=Ramlibacter aquaticus TaxID=2780094 RepID=A0ABR9SBT3_9BURK|nr:hypothetical protein [Ramlibacter aquaticus]MBE7939674.1 hypothetical protein [Ramlibacter aquaticus]